MNCSAPENLRTQNGEQLKAHKTWFLELVGTAEKTDSVWLFY